MRRRRRPSVRAASASSSTSRMRTAKRLARDSGAARTASRWAAKAEPAFDDDDGGADYDVFYQRLGMH
jgi:hypothetical protein